MKRLKVDEAARRLEREGWAWKPGKGSHRTYRHPERPGRITLAYHRGAIMGAKELREIARTAGWEDVL